MKRALSLILAFVFVIGICASSPITLTANAADDATNLTQTGEYTLELGEYTFTPAITGYYTFESINGLDPFIMINVDGQYFENDDYDVFYDFKICVYIEANTSARIELGEWEEAESVRVLITYEGTEKPEWSNDDDYDDGDYDDGDNSVINENGFSVKVISTDSCEITDYDDSNLTNGALVIPQTIAGYKVTGIGGYAFENCSNLTSVTIPDSVTDIGSYTFENCSSLVSVKLPEGITEIGDYVFCECTSLTDINIPDSVTSIKESAFEKCKSLKSVTLPSNLINIWMWAFFGCSSLTSIVIPDGVASIGPGAFDACESLVSVTIPDTVTIINDGTFGYKDFAMNGKTKIDGFTIYGVKGSAAEKYAIDNGFTFIEINGSDDHAHKYTEEITQQPTCTVEGTKTFTCSCGDTYTETIKATGHKWNSGSVTTEPTCTTQGEKTYVCTVCYDAKSELISAKGHKEVVIPAVAPTYKEPGKTEGKKCSVCGTITVAQKDVSKLTLATPVVTVKNSATGVKVTWKAIDGATSYKVYRKTYSTKTKKYGGWKTCGTATKTSYVDVTAKSGTKYIYTVKALNNDTKSGIKNSSSILFLAQPTVKIANASTGVKVTWNKITGATGYKVYRSEYNAKTKKWSSWKGIKTAKSTSKSYTDKSAKKGVKYRYTVKAVNGKTASTYKASSSVKR